MNARLLVPTLLGVAVGAVAVSLNPLHSAPVPEMRAQRWEYKVVACSLSRQGADADPVEKQLTDQFNALAREGWEHAGPVASESSGRGGGGFGSRQYVVFRRFKP
jgi:hypothetical protein